MILETLRMPLGPALRRNLPKNPPQVQKRTGQFQRLRLLNQKVQKLRMYSESQATQNGEASEDVEKTNVTSSIPQENGDVGNKGSSQLMRALIDQGSQSSFITEQADTSLGIKRKAVHAQISGIGNKDQRTSKWSVTLNLEAHFKNEFEMRTEAIVLRKITKNLPEKEIKMTERNHRNLVLADPNFNETGSIDILFGANEYNLILKDGVDRTKNALLAQNTKLGWIMSGIAQEENIPNIQVLSML
ncbi:unnamed protein product [Diabrotica balteata]|uniref:Peptidase aspartic putative domain-containing protein n=1 Tax=Diabrotica balteata TaxID=107213 RepID=A0A9N9SRG8_DIABA|nr:unnamed protein product [Diabrotica balteata]